MTFDKNENLAQEICSIAFILQSYILSIDYNDTDYTAEISVSPSASLETIYYTPGSASFTENEKEGKGGNYFDQVLKCFFPGEDESNSINLETAKGLPLVVIFQYTDGSNKFIGQNSPLFLCYPYWEIYSATCPFLYGF